MYINIIAIIYILKSIKLYNIIMCILTSISMVRKIQHCSHHNNMALTKEVPTFRFYAVILVSDCRTLPEQWCTSRTMAHSQNYGALSELWCTPRTMVHFQNYGTLPELWHTPRTMVHFQNYGALPELWHTPRTMVHSLNYGSLPELWCTLRTMVHSQNYGALPERWCTPRTMVTVFLSVSTSHLGLTL